MKKASTLASFFAGATLFCSASQAATTITDVFLLEPGTPKTALVQVQSWFNSQFGTMGWTHFSQWGQFEARKGQLVTITVSADQGMHPGVSVWWRNTGPATLPIQKPGIPKSNYYQGHSYNQYDSIKTGWLTSDLTGQDVGYLEMITAANGFDADGATISGFGVPNSALNPIYDGVPGQVTLTFRAPRNGTYQLVAGGAFPDAGVFPSPTNSTKGNITINLGIRR